MTDEQESEVYEVDLSNVDFDTQDSIGKLQDELRLEHEQKYPPAFVPDEEPPQETN